MRHTILLLMLLMVPSSLNAQYIKWEVGEDIGVTTLCRDKNTIMHLARADQSNEALVLETFASFASTGLCVAFNEHSPFTVVKTLYNYEDFNGQDSFCLLYTSDAADE